MSDLRNCPLFCSTWAKLDETIYLIYVLTNDEQDRADQEQALVEITHLYHETTRLTMITRKRARKRAAAIRHRANATWNRLFERVIDRSVAQLRESCPITQATFADWSQVAGATPLEDFMALKKLQVRGTS